MLAHERVPEALLGVEHDFFQGKLGVLRLGAIGCRVVGVRGREKVEQFRMAGRRLLSVPERGVEADHVSARQTLLFDHRGGGRLRPPLRVPTCTVGLYKITTVMYEPYK